MSFFNNGTPTPSPLRGLYKIESYLLKFYRNTIIKLYILGKIHEQHAVLQEIEYLWNSPT